MFRQTNFESLLQYDRFAFGREERDFLDDLSISSSEDSYDSLTTNESSSDRSASVAPPKKKYKTGPVIKTEEDKQRVKQWQQQQYMISHIPKLVKTDVRRSYSNIFANVINSLDFPLMFEFLKQYCVPDIIHTQTFGANHIKDSHSNSIATCGECTVKKFARITGLQGVAQFWYNKMSIMPDVVYSLLDSNVHTYSNTEDSQVVSSFNMSATKLFDIPMHVAIPNLKCAIEDTPAEREKAQLEEEVSRRKRAFSEFENAENIQISDEINSYMTLENMLPTPIAMKASMRMVMYLNDNKQIERMEFEATPQ